MSSVLSRENVSARALEKKQAWHIRGTEKRLVWLEYNEQGGRVYQIKSERWTGAKACGAKNVMPVCNLFT